MQMPKRTVIFLVLFCFRNAFCVQHVMRATTKDGSDVVLPSLLLERLLLRFHQPFVVLETSGACQPGNTVQYERDVTKQGQKYGGLLPCVCVYLSPTCS